MTYTEVVCPTTYIEAVHDFIPRFWSSLIYLGRLPSKSSDGRLPCKSSRKNIFLFYFSIAKLTWDDFHVSHLGITKYWFFNFLLDDLRVSRPEKSKFWHNPVKCKTNPFSLDDLHVSRLEFFLINKDGRLPCKSSRLKINCKTNLNGRY